MIERKAVGFEAKASGEGSELSGIAGGFHAIDDSPTRDIIAPRSFAAGIPHFLKAGFIAWQHDWSEPIGRPTHAEEVPRGLHLDARISDTARGRDAKTLLRDGVITKLSIGYSIPSGGRTYLETLDDVRRHWDSVGYPPTEADLAKAKAGGVRLLTRIDLHEVSLVSVPANANCSITAVKSAGFTFADHSESVLAAVEELLARARALKALRESEGRALSTDRLQEFKRLRALLDSLLEPLEAKAPPAAAEEVLALQTRLQATLARSYGIAQQGT